MILQIDLCKATFFTEAVDLIFLCVGAFPGISITWGLFRALQNVAFYKTVADNAAQTLLIAGSNIIEDSVKNKINLKN